MLKFVRAAKGKEVVIQNVSRDVYDVLELTRFVNLMTVKKLCKISVDGCEVIGKCRSSSVYRTDPETIVKLYTDGVPLEKIEQEIDLAKKAFVVGIPTAISYDLVRCGDIYGVVFEMIANADTVGRIITAPPDQFDEINRHKRIRRLPLAQRHPAQMGGRHVDGFHGGRNGFVPQDD